MMDTFLIPTLTKSIMLTVINCRMQCIAESILHGGPMELFLIPSSAPQLVYQTLWYVLFCLWDGAYKRTLAANQTE